MLCRGVGDEIIAVLVTVQRFWRPALINAVLPVILVFFLGMLMFITGGALQRWRALLYPGLTLSGRLLWLDR